MQVVYSGSSTPSPSPRLHRKMGYGRPIVPGYMAHVHPHILVQRSREKLTEGDITLRDSIPAMSTCTAIVCLVLNILLPGSGTLAAGLSVLCCSHVRPKDVSKGYCICINAGVALLQFLLTFLFLLGWIWSIMWGASFLSVSRQHFYRKEVGADAKQFQEAEKQKVQQQILHQEKSFHETNTGRNSSRSTEKSHNHKKRPAHYGDSRHQDQYHHYLEHYRRHTFKESAPDFHSSHLSDNTHSKTDGVTQNANKRTTLTIPNGYTQVSQVSGMKHDFLPVEFQQKSPDSGSDTFYVVSESISNGTKTAVKARHMGMREREINSKDAVSFPVTYMPTNIPDLCQKAEIENSSDDLAKH